MSSLSDEAKGDRTFWRGMYLISLIIGAVLPVATIIAAGVMTDDALPWSGQVSSATLFVMLLVWSGSTLVSILGMVGGAWITMATAEKLGIHRSRGYIRAMFLLAFANGGVVPFAAFIAVAVTSEALSRADLWLLVVAWGGMLSVCIAGISCAVWLVKTAAFKLCVAPGNEQSAREYQPQYRQPV